MIEYYRSTWPFEVREDLRSAGCEEKVAAVVAKALAELVDHVAHEGERIERDAASRRLARSHAETDFTGKLLAIGVIVLTLALCAGVLVALYR